MPHTDPEAYKAYMREYMKRRYHERHAEARQILGSTCAHPECNQTENLEIDHIDWRNKTMKVDRMAWVSHAKFIKELTLCQLLCNEHHIEKSRKDISDIRAVETKKGLRRDGQKLQRRQIVWPPDDELLFEYQTASSYKIAERLGCSHASVLNRIKQIKIKESK